jgi:MoaA/NifB/PqqE/SkfB family radical SAM enzyme
MKRIDLKFGYSCNNNCKFCILGDKKLNSENRTTKDLFNLIKKYSLEGYEKIVLTGGEITLRKDLIQLISFCKKCNYKIIHIESNGRLFSYEKLVKQVISAGANSFTISLHSHNEELYKKLSQADGFKEVIQAIKNIKKYTDNVAINCTINGLNYKFLKDILNLCLELNVVSINFPFINMQGSAITYKSEVSVLLKEMKPYLIDALNFAKQNNLVVSTEMIPFCFLDEFKSCAVEFYNKKMSIDSIDVHNTDFMKNLSKGRIKSDKCKDCIYTTNCFGINNDINAEENLKSILPILE